jgi:L-2-hydroxyglutarate oxidase LhgO
MARPVVVIGAGIVGAATAVALLRQRPTLRLMVLEKERTVAAHQTGHNSGVIHSGIYYRPGSLKARLCVGGRARLLEYIESHGLPHRICGKVIVATEAAEIPRLAELKRRGDANGVPGIRSLDAAGIKALEPEVAGRAGLHVPGTGITDYAEVVRSLVSDLGAEGAEVRTGCEVTGLRVGPGGVEVATSTGVIEAQYIVNAAGLHCDEVARMAGVEPPGRIVPFRGEYYLIRPERRDLVRGLVYPVPDPELPFLGVHLTPTVSGELEAGPNAVLALAREGYAKGDVDLHELVPTVVYPGFPRLAERFWRTSIHEGLRSMSRSIFLHDLQRLVPGLREEDLAPGGAGVRAQALRPSGELVDDFLLEGLPWGLHVFNAPSPAATCSFAIADELVAQIPATVR